MKSTQDKFDDDLNNLMLKLDELLDNTKFMVAFSAILHRTGELGVFFDMPKQEFLDMVNDGVSAAYDDALEDLANGELVFDTERK